ncbi:hypothetical protein FHG87_009434 [Trinorchestia longiramus]|nr:hypothetical protein FHG87_009434 [Trinorchestia longiramus]
MHDKVDCFDAPEEPEAPEALENQPQDSVVQFQPEDIPMDLMNGSAIHEHIQDDKEDEVDPHVEDVIECEEDERGIADVTLYDAHGKKVANFCFNRVYKYTMAYLMQSTMAYLMQSTMAYLMQSTMAYLMQSTTEIEFRSS